MSSHHLPQLDPEAVNWDEETFSRRRFFEIGFWTAASTAGLFVGGAGTRFFIGDSLESKPGQWVEVGLVTDFPTDQVHQARYNVRTFDAWREIEETGILYCLAMDNDEFIVLDATCTHLGCNVRWQEQAGVFACPCHDGLFTREGQVISGPPPEPLRRLETRIDGDVLLALI